MYVPASMDPATLRPEFVDTNIKCTNCETMDVLFQDGVVYRTIQKVDGVAKYPAHWFCTYECLLRCFDNESLCRA